MEASVFIVEYLLKMEIEKKTNYKPTAATKQAEHQQLQLCLRSGVTCGHHSNKTTAGYGESVQRLFLFDLKEMPSFCSE